MDLVRSIESQREREKREERREIKSGVGASREEGDSMGLYWLM